MKIDVSRRQLQLARQVERQARLERNEISGAAPVATPVFQSDTFESVAQPQKASLKDALKNDPQVQDAVSRFKAAVQQLFALLKSVFLQLISGQSVATPPINGSLPATATTPESING